MTQEELRELLSMVEDLISEGMSEEEAEIEAAKSFTKKEERRRSLPITDYLLPMDLTDEQKDEREALFYEFLDMATILLALVMMQKKTNKPDFNYVGVQASIMYLNIIESVVPETEDVDRHVANFVGDFIDVTERRIDDPWFLSEDRAVFIAENEAVSIMGYKDYYDAKQRGLKRKKWVAEIDRRTRKTHLREDGKTVGIDEYFRVGRALMMFPKDDFTPKSTGAEHPEEIINCRCVVKYF